MEGSSNDLSKKKRGKKKKGSMLDDAEIKTNEEQVQPLKKTLSYSIVQGVSEEHTLEESLPEGTQKRKRKGKRVKESSVDIHSTNGDVFEAQGSSIEENTVASVVTNSCVKAKGNTMEQQDGKLNESMSQTESPKAKKKKKRKKKTMEVCDASGNTTLATSLPVECMVNNDDKAGNEDIVGASLGDVTTKKQKRKKKKTSSAVVVEDTISKTESPEAATVESDQEALKAEGVSDVGRKKKRRKKNKNKNGESVANMDTESVQCLSYHSNTECVASKDLVSKMEDSTTEAKSVQNVENTKNVKEDNQDALGAEGVSKVEVKTKKKKKKKKKRKNSLDLKTDIMEEIKDDVSVPRLDEVPEMDSEKVETSLLQNVAEGQTGDIPRCSCEGQSTKKLIVLDLNGILADIVQGDTGEFVPDGRISYRSVFRRPFVARFLDVCFEKFEVGIWSSRRIGLDYMINTVMRNHARNLLFCFDQSVCITTNFKTQENTRKPVFLKDLKRVWYRFGKCFTCGKQKYDATNTLLVDDSPHKALCNPPHTGIFPFPYQYTDLQDSSLGPNGELSKYLERLADAENVQKFVEENPFGQTAITETHESWEYYSKVIEAYK